MGKQGLLLVVSGPSGAGKGTVCERLLSKNSDLKVSVSVTTRAPRKGEIDGVHYHFKTKEEFNELVEQGQFLEYAEVHGNYYGTLKKTVRDMLLNGDDVILEIDIQGALMVKEMFSDGVFVFIVPPSMNELKQRIVGRGSETEESLMTRFKNAYKELTFISRYNYVVVNDKVDDAVSKIEAIITAEKCSVNRNKEIEKQLCEGEN